MGFWCFSGQAFEDLRTKYRMASPAQMSRQLWETTGSDRETRVSPTLTLSFKSQPLWMETHLQSLQLCGIKSPVLCLERSLMVFPTETNSGAESANFVPRVYTGTRETPSRSRNTDLQAHDLEVCECLIPTYILGSESEAKKRQEYTKHLLSAFLGQPV